MGSFLSRSVSFSFHSHFSIAGSALDTYGDIQGPKYSHLCVPWDRDSGNAYLLPLILSIVAACLLGVGCYFRKGKKLTKVKVRDFVERIARAHNRHDGKVKMRYVGGPTNDNVWGDLEVGVMKPSYSVPISLPSSCPAIPSAPAYQDVIADEVERDNRGFDELPILRLQSLIRPEDPSVVPVEYFESCTNGWNENFMIGDGVFGDVYLATDVQRNFRFVVKKVNLASLASLYQNGTPESIAAKMHENEIVSLKKFRGSPFVVRLVGFTKPSGTICLAYEYCEEGSLDKALLDDGRARKLTWKVRIRIALGIAKGLNYLHMGGGGERCFHRDVKSANICLTAAFSPKLIDCGLAKFIPMEGEESPAQLSSLGGRVGTMGYKCPMYDAGQVDFSEKTDAFAFGVVLLELITGNITLQGPRRNLYCHFLDLEEESIESCFDERAAADESWPEMVKTILTELAKKCLEKPKKRIGIQAAMRQLIALETEFCQLSHTESELQRCRERISELEAGLSISDTRSLVNNRTCVACLDTYQLEEGLECNGSQAKHFYCQGCWVQNLKEFGANALVRNGNSRRFLCRHNGCNTEPFEDKDFMAKVGSILALQRDVEASKRDADESRRAAKKSKRDADESRRAAEESKRDADDLRRAAECVICMGGQRTHTILPCGHKVLCDNTNCIEGVWNDESCPICRGPIGNIIRIYD